jgi:uncharacterized protein YkwD
LEHGYKIQQGVVLTLSLFLFSLFIDLPKARADISGREVLAEINLARTDPLGYAEFLKEFRGHFQGKSYRLPGMNTVIETNEGVAAVDAAIAFLAGRKALPPLKWSEALAAAATELAEEQGRSGATGHKGVQSGGIAARIKRQGISGKVIGENIGYGPNSPRGMVMQLLIDDGVPNRGHRKNHFNSAYTKAGVSCGPHPQYQKICVIDFWNGRRK